MIYTFRFTEMLNNATANQRRYELVVNLEDASKDQPEVQTWCHEQKELVLRTLKPVSKDEIEWLISVIKTCGATYLCDVYVKHFFLRFSGADDNRLQSCAAIKSPSIQ